MVDMDRCGEFELELQQAMDERSSPLDCLAGHPHLDDCENCRQLLQDFESLHQVLPVVMDHPGLSVPAEEVWNQTSVESGLSSRSNRSLDVRRSWAPRRQQHLLGSLASMAGLVLVGLWVASTMEPGVVSGRRGPEVVVQVPSLGGQSAGSLFAEESGSGLGLGFSQFSPLPLFNQAMGDGGRPAQSLASCIWIAEQIPGVPPVRTSVERTLDWVLRVIPRPKLPDLPDLIPDLGMQPDAQWLCCA